jgi:hypothetical protein
VYMKTVMDVTNPLSSFLIRRSDAPTRASIITSTAVDTPAQFSMPVTPSTIGSTAVDTPAQFSMPVATLTMTTFAIVAITLITSLPSTTDTIPMASLSALNTLPIPTSLLSSSEISGSTLNPVPLKHYSLSAPVTGGIAAAATLAGIAAILCLIWLNKRRKWSHAEQAYGDGKGGGNEKIQELPGDSPISPRSNCLSELDSIRPVSELESIATSNERWSATRGTQAILPTLPNVAETSNSQP